MEEWLRRLASIGERIGEARETAERTQQQLSVLMGVSRDDIRSWEAGRSRPSLDQVLGLASVCGVSPDWLLGRDLIEEALLEEAKRSCVCLYPSRSISELPLEDLDSIREFILYVSRWRESSAGALGPGPLPPNPQQPIQR